MCFVDDLLPLGNEVLPFSIYYWRLSVSK